MHGNAAHFKLAKRAFQVPKGDISRFPQEIISIPERYSLGDFLSEMRRFLLTFLPMDDTMNL